MSEQCPTCESPDRKRHPAVQHEGEVQVCPDAWHRPFDHSIRADRRLSVLEWSRERFANTLRLAASKTGEDRDGWLEDASYWQEIVARLQK